MGWSGVAASLASPTIPIVFSPPAARRRASKKALGDATNKANQVVVLHKEAKKTPTKPVAEPPHEAAHAQHATWLGAQKVCEWHCGGGGANAQIPAR